MTLEDRLLIELHRAATLAGHANVIIPSVDLADIKKQMGDQRVRNALRRLAQARRVLAVRKDLIVLLDATGRITVGVPEIVDAVAPRPYLITGARALEASRLTDQHSFTVVALVTRDIRPFEFRGEKAVFIKTREELIWGAAKGTPKYALPERAVLDSLRSSRYGVPFPMARDALIKAVRDDPRFVRQLFKALRRFGSSALARRVGLLLEDSFGEKAAASIRQLSGNSRTPIPLRPGGVPHGEMNRSWRVLLNAASTSGKESE